MGDHGGGQPAVFAEVAKKLDAKYAPQGKHVYFCDEVYKKAQDDFDKWLVAHGYPRSSHAGIPDTSEMLVPRRRQGLGPYGADSDGRGRSGSAARRARPGRGTPDPNAPPRKNNGITGDARRSIRRSASRHSTSRWITR